MSTATAVLIALAAGAAAAWALWKARRLEERLAQSGCRLDLERATVETLLENITDGLVLVNLRGEVVYVNAHGRDVLGMEPQDLVETHKGLLRLKDKGLYRMKVQRILKNHTYSEFTELQVRGANGPTTRYFQTTVRLVTTPMDGEPGVALVLRDVTAEKNLDALKEEFFHAIANDLRAPLFAVQGYLRLLEKSLRADNEQKGYVDAISQCCEKLGLFIQDTLDSIRMEAGNFKLSLSTVDTKALLQRVSKLFSPLVHEKGIRLETELAAGESGRIEADERLLERVFYNLLSNAVKFTPPGGRITVELDRAGPAEVEFTVSDTGPGIPEEQRSLIFEKYRNPHNDRAQGGFGLGLYVSKKIVQLHNGTIWVDASKKGPGCRLMLRLPIKQAAPAPAAS